GHRARIRADASAARTPRDRGGRHRAPRRPVAVGEGAADVVAPTDAAAVGGSAIVRRRARARLARADADREAPRHPELDDLRLRVRLAPAPARLSSGDEG